MKKKSYLHVYSLLLHLSFFLEIHPISAKEKDKVALRTKKSDTWLLNHGRMRQPIPKLRILNFHECLNPITNKTSKSCKTCYDWSKTLWKFEFEMQFHSCSDPIMICFILSCSLNPTTKLRIWIFTNLLAN